MAISLLKCVIKLKKSKLTQINNYKMIYELIQYSGIFYGTWNILVNRFETKLLQTNCDDI